MSRRLGQGGLLIDRRKPVGFRWNGRSYGGFAGDTLASALLANGEVLMGRSFKYHRPRGVVASGVEEPNALATIGTGGRFEPNVRATTAELFDGMEARSQNHWPSLRFDLGAVAGRVAGLLPAGFYYKTFLAPRIGWERLFEPLIRRAAGLGRVPEQADLDSYEYFYAHVDVLVVGGGVAGLTAARAAGAAGARVLVIEQAHWWGGRALVDGGTIEGLTGPEWVSAQLLDFDRLPNVTLRTRMTGAAVEDHGYVLAEERVTDHAPDSGPVRRRLWRIRARRIVVATGAIERPLAFAGNDRPGVMLAGAVRDFAGLWGVAAGARTVVVTNNDDAYRTAIALVRAGYKVPAVLDARPEARGELPQAARALGIRVAEGWGVAGVTGGRRVTGVEACAQARAGGAVELIACDAVAMSGGWSPAVHLWSHCGGKLVWDEAQALFAPDPARPPTGADGAGFALTAGSASGALETGAALLDAHRAGRQAAEEVGLHPGDEAAPSGEVEAEKPIEAVWTMPRAAPPALLAKAFLDFQNDVKVSDIRLAAQEGFESVEHAKRYTTLGMATDQGKLSNINGLAVLAGALGSPIPQVGTTTFRPPYAPVAFGALAGEARGLLFKPVRRTPLDAWQEARGATWEPVGDWRRAYAYPVQGETVDGAVIREVNTVRSGVGVLDASTLGKILVQGPDAGYFLDRIYTGLMSTLKLGRCRYGLMCNENGFVFDDGVVVRIGEDAFLCHTTTGGSDRVHAWLEEWLQTEWWDLKVYTANVTEQFAQFVVAGPEARAVLEKLGGMDVSRAALPFLASAEGVLGGFAARVHRISFSGELSFEIAVPAGQGPALWEAILEAGRPFGIAPYGIEAMHVMRAEKGYVIVGDETDGTVTPQDLGFGWAISRKKPDYIGKRAQERADLARPGRKQFVGLLTEEPGYILPDGAHAVAGDVNPEGPTPTIGHVTSSYYSPTLGRSIALGLVEDGRALLGKTLNFPVEANRIVRAEVVDPVFYDKEGVQLDA